VVVLICAMHFGLQSCSICEEFGVEGYEELGIQLCMRVEIGLGVLLIKLICTNLEEVIVPGDTRPRLDDVFASLEYILALNNKFECGFYMFLHTQGANNSRVTKYVSLGKNKPPNGCTRS